MNTYFMPRVQPRLRLCGPLSTSGVGAGRHLWPHDSISARLISPSSTLKPINGFEAISADGKGEEGGPPSFLETA